MFFVPSKAGVTEATLTYFNFYLIYLLDKLFG